MVVHKLSKLNMGFYSGKFLCGKGEEYNMYTRTYVGNCKLATVQGANNYPINSATHSALLSFVDALSSF